MNAPPIEVHRLLKRYGDSKAVDGVDLTVSPGSVHGFLGPNGAGKTTTLRMLLALVRPDAGTIRLFGNDPTTDAVRALRGVAGIIEEPRLYPYLSGRENLRLLASFDRSATVATVVDEALAMVELSDRASDRVAAYSQGMRQRLGIASCLVRGPKLLLLDEPANGVDPAGIRFLRDLLHQLASDGVTILLSSHLLAEVEAVCDQVTVIDHGRIVYDGSLADLRSTAGPRYRLRTTDQERAGAICRRLGADTDVNESDDSLAVAMADAEAFVALTRALGEADVGITSLVRQEASLEELFFHLTKASPATSRGATPS